jgi:hypothetical protein
VIDWAGLCDGEVEADGRDNRESDEARANKKMPELMAATMHRLRETDPKAAQAAPRDDRGYGCVIAGA